MGRGLSRALSRYTRQPPRASFAKRGRTIAPREFPSRQGGAAEDAFDLVIPSLPGFGFSGKPEAPIGARTTARLFDKLMREAFGYDRYRVQGGD